MKIDTCIYYITARVLLYLIHHAKVTSCHELVLPRITVLYTNQTLDLSRWRDHLDVELVTIPVGNLSFYDALEITEKTWRDSLGKRETRAIIGSGNTIIDGLITRTVGSVMVPFISITKHDNYQSHLYVNLFPSTRMDHDHIVLDIAVELGCQHVTIFTSKRASSTTLQKVQMAAKDRGVSFRVSMVQLVLNDTFLGLVNTMNEIYKIANYSSVLVVMECSEQDASLIVKATKAICVRTEFQWMILRNDGHVTNNVGDLPTGVLSIRPIFVERDGSKMIHDAITLLNYSLHGKEQRQRENEGCFNTNVNNNLRLYRKLLMQKFQGKTGWVQFDEDGNRVAASYDIIKTCKAKASSRGVAWVTVGSVVGRQISLNESFWMDDMPDNRKVLRVVIIEEEPMLVVSKESVAMDSECVLSHPCTRYKEYGNNSKHIRPVKCCCTGFLMDVLNWLVKDLSIAVDLYLVRDGKFGAYNAISKQWDGMIADLLSDKADMALSTLTTTKIRAQFVDFSYPFFYGETKLLISPTVEGELEFGFLVPFDEILWIVLLITLQARGSILGTKRR